MTTNTRLCDGWRELTKRQDAILRALREVGLQHKGLSKDALAPSGDIYPKAHVRALKDLASRGLIEAVWPDGDPYGIFRLTRAGWACFGEQPPPVTIDYILTRRPKTYAPVW